MHDLCETCGRALVPVRIELRNGVFADGMGCNHCRTVKVVIGNQPITYTQPVLNSCQQNILEVVEKLRAYTPSESDIAQMKRDGYDVMVHPHGGFGTVFPGIVQSLALYPNELDVWKVAYFHWAINFGIKRVVDNLQP